MKLLVITQKVDKNDPVLGFFHSWIIELSKRFEAVSVVCLEKGESELPANVKVYSLGKESKRSRIKYVTNFYNYIVGLNREYDAVLVHMNQEYMILGGMFWKLLRKKVYFWRNHPHGNLLTRVAVSFADKIFCTSKFSYTARFTKTELMPVGIDTEKFKGQIANRKENSILSLGRISPVKNIHLIIEAAKILKGRGVDFILDIVGDSVNPEDAEYKKGLIESSKSLPINFLSGVSNAKTPEIYSSYKIFVNLTPSGSFDKTILEAAACGALTVVANESLQGEINQKLITQAEAGAVADSLEYWLKNTNIGSTQKELENYVIEKHSLHALMDKLCSEIKR